MGLFQRNEKPCDSIPERLILAIDDDKNIRILLSAFLRKHYRVETKEDGLAGMSWLYHGNLPDLIIVDVDMPRLNGYEFLTNLRRSGFFQHIPVIVLSGIDRQSVKTKCLENGADDYLVKPFNPEEILKKIERVLALREEEEEHSHV